MDSDRNQRPALRGLHLLLHARAGHGSDPLARPVVTYGGLAALRGAAGPRARSARTFRAGAGLKGAARAGWPGAGAGDPARCQALIGSLGPGWSRGQPRSRPVRRVGRDPRAFERGRLSGRAGAVDRQLET